jgi:hypothetical protein
MPSDGSGPSPPPATQLRIEPLEEGNRGSVMELAKRAWDRSRNADSLEWRYRRCPALEASVALAGDQCVATIFALKRTYWSAAGDVDCLEVFDWMTTEQWRPLGAGLRVMKRLMAGRHPLLALGGAAAGQELVKRMGWRHLATAERLVLPLSGRFLAQRGRSAAVARAFDLVGSLYYAPRRRRRSVLRIEPGGSPGPALGLILERQRRFALAPRVERARLEWFRQAPPEMGLYLGFNILFDDTMIGWAWARVLTANGIRMADLQDLLIAEEAREHYPEAIEGIAAALAGFGVDAIYSTTSCPDTLRALRQAHFRFDDVLPVYGWWPGTPPEGPVLVTSSHAEHAFFPCPTSAEAAWVTP